MDPLLTHEGELRAGTVVDRPNRFVVRVRFDGDADAALERAFLGDPGALAALQPGRTVLCSPADDPERKTDYDAIAVDADGVLVSLRAALANDLVERALERDALPAFDGYAVDRREPPLPDHGRADFRLETPAGATAYVEVKSCTHVEDGVGKFPDRQTERGRRHLRSLRGLVEDGQEAHVAFVIQRPDAEVLRPFRAVDPDFADLLGEVRTAGVGVHAMAVAFDPPHYRLADPEVPVELA
ncbi:MAG: DNA/RNA nuclease SfsA [Halobacteriales archaeon]